MSGGPQPAPPLGGSEDRRLRKEKGEREREKTWVFHSRIDFELNSVVRGRAGADTPMSIQDFDVLISIQDFDVQMAIQDDETPLVNR